MSGSGTIQCGQNRNYLESSLEFAYLVTRTGFIDCPCVSNDYFTAPRRYPDP